MAHQMRQQLLQLPPVGPHVAGHVAAAQRHAVLACLCLPALQHGRQQLGQRQRLGAAAARLGAGQRQQLVHQRHHLRASRVDALQPLALARAGWLADVVAQQLREPQHRVHRRAQLVAHARQEGRLVAAGLLGTLGLLAQRVGLPALGDVEVDAGHAQQPALLVAQRPPVRDQPALLPVGPQHAELEAVGRAVAQVALHHAVQRRQVVGVADLQHQLFHRAWVGRVEAAQAVHGVVPVADRAVEPALPDAQLGGLDGKPRALAFALQPRFVALAVGHVQMHAEGHALAVAHEAARPALHPAFAAAVVVGGAEDRVHLRLPVVAGAQVQRHHPGAVADVHVLVDPGVEARRPALRVAPVDAVHLRVPVRRAGVEVAAPEAHADRLGRQPRVLDQHAGALLRCFCGLCRLHRSHRAHRLLQGLPAARRTCRAGTGALCHTGSMRISVAARRPAGGGSERQPQPR